MMKSTLLSWYREHKRNLPWRSTKDPYLILVSEIMLQQTRVSAVIDKYQIFVKHFPTIESLAVAKLEEVLEQWKGLGYYSRARNLKKTCEQIYTQQLNPKTAVEWQRFTGIGDYTAAAVASIAFSDPVMVLDGNVIRVISRVCGLDFLPANKKLRTVYEKKGREKLFCTEESADSNQAMMELGALICTPFPNCGKCPLQKNCFALQNNKVKEFPVSKAKKQIETQSVFIFVFTRNHKIVTTHQGWRGYQKGYVFFPLYEVSDFVEAEKMLILDYPDCDKEFIFSGKFFHSITRYRLICHVYFQKDLVLDSSLYPSPAGTLLKKAWELSC